MKDFETILAEMLAAVPPDLDKREGSVIAAALAPMAAQVAELYFYAGNLLDAAMPDTGRGEDLTRVCGIYGVNRYKAAKAVRKAVFTDAAGSVLDIPSGTRFGAEQLSYAVTGSGQVTCEQSRSAEM